MTDTKTRLQWLLTQLDNLNNGGNIRYEGNATFQGAHAELVDIIATYVDHSAEPAPVVMQAMTPDQVDVVVNQIIDIVTTTGVTIIQGLHAEIQKSDAAIMSAIVETGADTVTALKPAGEPAAA
jgi:glutamine amidotransferase-like uncharacterized protein